MVRKQKIGKSIRKAVEVIIIVFLSIALSTLILYLNEEFKTRPFNTKEKKQVKSVYEAAMKEIPGFKLISVYINYKPNSAAFNLMSTDSNHSTSFSESELEQIYKATKQLKTYLNENDFLQINDGYLLNFYLEPLYYIS